MTATSDDVTTQLARVFDAILSEVRRNPDLAHRIEGAIRGSGRAPVRRATHRRQPGSLDPFEVHAAGGPDGLRQRLEGLGVEQLKDIVSEHGMDRTKLAMKWKTPNRLVDLIVETVSARAKKGEVFRGG
jgi:hypothetical protein